MFTDKQGVHTEMFRREGHVAESSHRWSTLSPINYNTVLGNRLLFPYPNTFQHNKKLVIFKSFSQYTQGIDFLVQSDDKWSIQPTKEAGSRVNFMTSGWYELSATIRCPVT